MRAETPLVKLVVVLVVVLVLVWRKYLRELRLAKPALFGIVCIALGTAAIGVLAIVPAAGITHAMSGVGEAFLDGVPMLVVSGGIRTDMKQSFQLHDVDQQALMRPLTKAAYRIESYDEVVDTVYRAYRTAIEGEPGPVYVELPANMQMLTGEAGEIPAFDASVPRPATIQPARPTAGEGVLPR